MTSHHVLSDKNGKIQRRDIHVLGEKTIDNLLKKIKK